MSRPIHWLGEDFPPAQTGPATSHIRDKLIELKVLEKEGEKPSFAKTPPSLQVITAGATQFSKWWAALAAAGVGGSALVQGLSGLGWLPGGENTTDLQQAVLTGSAALLGSSLVIAIAVIVRGDVIARAQASAAEYQARAQMATALIASFQYPPPEQPSPPAPEARYVLHTRGNEWHLVKSLKWDTNKLVAVVEGGKEIPAEDFDWVTAMPESNGR